MKIKFLGVAALTLLLATACTKKESVVFIMNPDMVDPEPTNNATTIGDKATFSIGAAIAASDLNNNAVSNTLNTHFTQITAEYEMKMARIWSSSTSFNWNAADAIVAYAENNDMEVHGHTLVWYQSFPDWFKNANYDSTAFESHVKNYITTVVSRYKGRIKSWDVVNEVFADGGALRQEGTIKPVFKDPIAFYGRCFQYARDADPDAKLFYNDYSVVLDSGKRYAMKKMAERFVKEGYPIDGLGDQFHYMQSTNKSTITAGFQDLARSGLLIHISELDIRMNVNKSDSYVFNATEQEKQYATYKYIAELYEDLPQDQKFAITTWGIHDGRTWLTDWWHPKEYPLLFDADLNKKRAYEGFFDGLN